ELRHRRSIQDRAEPSIPRIEEVDESDDVATDHEIIGATDRVRGSRLSATSITLSILLLVSSLKHAESCAWTTAITASTQNCARDSEGVLTCRFQKALLMSFQTRGQENCILLKGDNSEPMGTLKIRITDVRYICQPDEHYYTR